MNIYEWQKRKNSNNTNEEKKLNNLESIQFKISIWRGVLLLFF